MVMVKVNRLSRSSPQGHLWPGPLLHHLPVVLPRGSGEVYIYIYIYTYIHTYNTLIYSITNIFLIIYYIIYIIYF